MLKKAAKDPRVCFHSKTIILYKKLWIINYFITPSTCSDLSVFYLIFYLLLEFFITFQNQIFRVTASLGGLNVIWKYLPRFEFLISLNEDMLLTNFGVVQNPLLMIYIFIFKLHYLIRIHLFLHHICNVMKVDRVYFTHSSFHFSPL